MTDDQKFLREVRELVKKHQYKSDMDGFYAGRMERLLRMLERERAARISGKNNFFHARLELYGEE